MINAQAVLLRFAEPFMDSKYSKVCFTHIRHSDDTDTVGVKIDRIDANYLARSARIDIHEETRIKAVSDDVTAWSKEIQASGGVYYSFILIPIVLIISWLGPSPNFITEVFFMTAAISHYGLNRTLQTFDDMHKQTDDIQRHIDFLNSSMASLQPEVREMLRESRPGLKYVAG